MKRFLLAIVILASLASTACGNEMDDLISAVNKERVSRGLSPVKNDVQLSKGSSDWAVNMWSKKSMYHSSGYNENIAWNQPTVGVVMRDWMNSSGHRANILNPRWRHIGVGKCGPYWCQRFK